MCDRIKAEVGHPTVLFNNAGLARGSTIMEGTSNDVQLTLKTNLIAPFLLVREFLPEMVRKDHGHILNTGSMSSVVSAPTIVDYSASKAGLTGLHEVFIRTPLFTGKTNESNVVAPLLNVKTVSDKLVDAAYSGYGGTVHLPGICRYITSLKGGPEWLFWRIRERSLRVDYNFERQRNRYDQDIGKRIAPGPKSLE
ncbi:hypothetical protein J3458_009239 [Metarhizium acridum]|uniref:uncharacterized protein n=1 Tax=Metarhizium acridum TaxID=92637 RepID=UPI001C6BFE7F|nr:hypothetical protein J3458_009239 [Metarhizium acridum]